MPSIDSSSPQQQDESLPERQLGAGSQDAAASEPEVAAVWQVRSGLDFRQAEALLDQLEQCGCTCREVLRSEDGQSFTVRWRP
jgi:hypothetical protein